MGGGQHATRQEHLARQTIAEAPQDFLAHIGLEAIEGEDDPPLRWRQAPPPGRVLEQSATRSSSRAKRWVTVRGATAIPRSTNA